MIEKIQPYHPNRDYCQFGIALLRNAEQEDCHFCIQFFADVIGCFFYEMSLRVSQGTYGEHTGADIG